MKYFIGVAIALSIWVLVSVLRKKKASTSHHVADLAEPWLSARGINRDSLMFNVYSEPGLARTNGAVVIVGNGHRTDGSDVGVVVEVLPGSGVVAGEELIPPGIATWHRDAALTAARTQRPLMDVLIEMALRHSEKNRRQEPSRPPWTPDQWKRTTQVIPDFLRASFAALGRTPDHVLADDWSLGYVWGFFAGWLRTLPVPTLEAAAPELGRAGFEAFLGSTGAAAYSRCFKGLGHDGAYAFGAKAGEADWQRTASAIGDHYRTKTEGSKARSAVEQPKAITTEELFRHFGRESMTSIKSTRQGAVKADSGSGPSVSDQRISAWIERFPTAPDFMSRQPARVMREHGHLICHVKDVPPIAARLLSVPGFQLNYLQALVVIDEESGQPVLFVTLEKGAADALFLCVVRKDGSRANLGDGSELAADRDFLRRALSLVREETKLHLSEAEFL